MVNKRTALSKKIRFEVFKRDSFTCQYCGKSAPDVVLHVDHINPVKNGGDNDIMNLVTACAGCNGGKGSRELSDKSVVEKQKKQLDELNEKRIQLEMMIKWREDMSDIISTQIDYYEKVLFKNTGYGFNDVGRNEACKHIKKYGFELMIESAECARAQYVKFPEEEKADLETVEKAIRYAPRIAANKKREHEKPYLKDLYYIRGIVKNRMYCNDHVCLEMIENAYKSGLSIDDMKHIARTARNWTNFREEIWEQTL